MGRDPVWDWTLEALWGMVRLEDCLPPVFLRGWGVVVRVRMEEGEMGGLVRLVRWVVRGKEDKGGGWK